MRDDQDTWLPQPDLRKVDVGTVLSALADPVRLQIVRLLDEQGEGSCTTLDVPVKHSTVSHHLRTLRESGLVATRLAGNARLSRLRTADLEHRFPGLLSSILTATPPAAPAPTAASRSDPANRTDGANRVRSALARSDTPAGR